MDYRNLLIGNHYVAVQIGVNGVKIATSNPPAGTIAAIEAAGVPVVERAEDARIAGSIGVGIGMPRDVAGFAWQNTDDQDAIGKWFDQLKAAGLIPPAVY